MYLKVLVAKGASGEKIMKTVFFTSDLHIGHQKVSIERGFNSVEEHDNFIISNWNKAINPTDTIYILGDIVFYPSINMDKISKLNGIKNLIMGNHDDKTNKYISLFNKVLGCHEYKRDDKRFILTHFPVSIESVRPRYDYNLHGHIHINDNVVPKPVSKYHFNLNLELHDYRPVDYRSMLEMIERQ